ncbi:hypothetical protein [Paenibacillus protaetiae]|uniref:Uncharacterized protein n=1 Tax=Paenibacillus protaetiae TaxID=2509456 RepID=A0A4P6EUR1_9BACL|nr:hypothetical protein [Paenibacillus protaetiae]QAY65863.1 hypothetical protein ET464_05180 [Paenibacillus protaetiae]
MTTAGISFFIIFILALMAGMDMLVYKQSFWESFKEIGKFPYFMGQPAIYLIAFSLVAALWKDMNIMPFIHAKLKQHKKEKE